LKTWKKLKSPKNQENNKFRMKMIQLSERNNTEVGHNHIPEETSQTLSNKNKKIQQISMPMWEK